MEEVLPGGVIAAAESLAQELAGLGVGPGAARPLRRRDVLRQRREERRAQQVRVVALLLDREAQRRVLGGSHATVGGYILGIWAFPQEIVEAVTLHHTPEHQTAPAGFGILAALHVADALVRERDDESPAILSHPYLDALGLTHRIDAWRGVCETALSLEPAP